MKNNNFNKIVLGAFSVMALVVPINVKALTKDETVYSVLGKDGSLKSTSVTTHLYGNLPKETEDITLLENVINLKGKSAFTFSDRCLRFQNNGEDIYYSGTLKKEMPIKSDIKYYLDGKEVQEKDLNGKKGTIKIEISLTNLEEHYINKQKLYTPFVVTLGGVINDKSASGMEITNGKIVKSGSKNIIVGLASPGISTSLNLSDLKDLDKIVITYKTNNYKTNTFYLVASPKVFSKDDLEVFNKLDSAFTNIESLQSNMDKLEAGSKQIYNELEKKIAQIESSTSVIDDETLSMIKSEARSSVQSNLSSRASSIKAQAKGAIEGAINEENIAKMAMANAIKDPIVSALATTETSSVMADNDLMNSFQMEAAGMFADYSGPDKADLIAGKIKEMVALEVEKRITPYVESAISEKITQILTSTNYCSSTSLDYLRSALTDQNNLAALEACDVYNTALLVSGSIKREVSSSIGNSVYSAVSSASLSVADQVSEAVATSVADSMIKETVSSLKTLKDAVGTLSSGLTEYNTQGINALSSYAKSANGYKTRLDNLATLADNYKGYGSENSDNTTFVSVIK